MDLGCSRYAGLRGPFRTGLLFLFHLAWKSRVRLPVLIAIGFMVLDIRMQFEINIDLGRAGRQGAPILGQGVVENVDLDDTDETLTVEESDDSDSYTTDSYSFHSNYNTDSEYEVNEDYENSVSKDAEDNSLEEECQYQEKNTNVDNKD